MPTGGRVLCAIGYSGADVDFTKIDVAFRSPAGTVAVCQNGAGIPFSEEQAKSILSESEIETGRTERRQYRLHRVGMRPDL